MPLLTDTQVTHAQSEVRSVANELQGLIRRAESGADLRTLSGSAQQLVSRLNTLGRTGVPERTAPPRPSAPQAQSTGSHAQDSGDGVDELARALRNVLNRR